MRKGLKKIIAGTIALAALAIVVVFCIGGDGNIKERVGSALKSMDTENASIIQESFNELDKAFKGHEKVLSDVTTLRNSITPKFYDDYSVMIICLYQFEGKFNDNVSRNIRKYLNSRSHEKIGQKPNPNKLYCLAEDFLPEYLIKDSPAYAARRAVLNHPELLYHPDKMEIEQLNNACISDLKSADSDARAAALYILLRLKEEAGINDKIYDYIKSENDSFIIQDLLLYLGGRESANAVMFHGFLNRMRELKLSLDSDQVKEIVNRINRVQMTCKPIIKDMISELLLLANDPNIRGFEKTLIPGDYKNQFYEYLEYITGLYKTDKEWNDWWMKYKEKSNDELARQIYNENMAKIDIILKKMPSMMQKCRDNLRGAGFLFPDDMFLWLSEQVKGEKYSKDAPLFVLFDELLLMAGFGHEKSLDYLSEIVFSYASDNQSECSEDESTFVSHVTSAFKNSKSKNSEDTLRQILQRYYGRKNNGTIISNALLALLTINPNQDPNLLIGLAENSKTIYELNEAVQYFYQIPGMIKYIEDSPQYQYLIHHMNDNNIKQEEVAKLAAWWADYLKKKAAQYKKDTNK